MNLLFGTRLTDNNHGQKKYASIFTVTTTGTMIKLTRFVMCVIIHE